MDLVTQEYALNVIPGGVAIRVHVSQYDAGSRTLIFNLYEGGAAYAIPSGADVTCEGIAPGQATGFSIGCGVSGNTASLVLNAAMTKAAGDVQCRIVVRNGDTILASAEFVLQVAKSDLMEKGTLTRYYYLWEVPGSSATPHSGYRQAVDAAMTVGAITGRSGTGEDTVVDLSDDACRLITVMYKAGVFEDLDTGSYHLVTDVPGWAQEEVQEMIECGAIRGKGYENGVMILDLEANLLRSMIMIYRVTKVMSDWKGTQAEYDALESHDPDRLYFILEDQT